MLLTSSLLYVLAGCSGKPALVEDSPVPDGDDTQGTDDTGPTTTRISGAAQKGPMLLGSSIDVAAIDSAGNPTGEVFGTATTDDLGTFALTVAYSGGVALTAEGYHYDELQGRLSTAPITLRAVAQLAGGGDQRIHISPLTHLAAPRVSTLIAAGATFDEAVTQAEDELVLALGIGPTGFDPGATGTDLDLLGGDTDGNAWLFAVSAVFLQAAWDQAGDGGSGDATLQQLLNNVANDLSDDGAIDPAYTTQLRTAETRLDIDAVTANLQARVDELGSSAVVPDLRRIIDHDLDGIADADDLDVDGDGYDGIASGGEDCEDEDAGISPAAGDVCEDGVDQDCSGTDAQCPLAGTVVGLDVADIVLPDPSGQYMFVGGLGDMNGDGIDDFALVDYIDVGPSQLQVYAGAPGGPSTTPVATVTGLYDNDGLFSADPVGDLDGDGVGDVIVGFCADATVGFASGAAYILSGPLVGEVSLPDARAVFVSDTEWDFTGYDVAGIGDVDGDSWPDVAISSPGVDVNGTESGAVYVLTGQPSGTPGPADAAATILGTGPNEMFGYTLAGGGDADGDGVADLLVRAIGVTGGSGSYLGATYLFTGGLTGSMTLADASLRVVGTKSGQGASSALAFAGDVDDDGLDDIVFNPYIDTRTAVSLFLGGRTGDLTPEDADSVFTSDATTDCAGAALGTASDLDGDGAIDLVVGAPCWDATHGAPEPDQVGRAYLFYGPLSGSHSLVDADAIVQGATSMAQFGSPAAVGDVSGDGWQDLVITQTHGAMLFLGAEP